MKTWTLKKALKSPVITGFLFLIAIILVTGCNSEKRQLAKKPVVKINDIELDAKEFSVQLAHRLRNFDALAAKNPQNISRAKEEILKDFILSALTKKWAAEHSIQITSEQIEKKINEIRGNYPDDISFRQELARENISFDHWRNDLTYSLLEKAVFEKITSQTPAPTEDEMREYYQNNKDLFRQDDRIYLDQIVLENEGAADSILAELKKGASFSALAKKFSIAPEGKNGGVVGWVSRGTLEVFDKAFSVPINTVSKVFESPYGYHIFKVEKLQRAGLLDFSQAQPKIKIVLSGQKAQAAFTIWLDGEVRKTHIFRDDALIKGITVQTRGKND